MGSIFRFPGRATLAAADNPLTITANRADSPEVMAQGHTICVGSLWKLLEAGEAHGVSRELAARQANLRDEWLVMDDPTPLLDRRVGPSFMEATWRVIMQRARSPGLPITISRTTRVGDYGLFGFLIKTSPNVREAFERARRFLALWTQAGALDLVDTIDGSLEVHYRHYDAGASLGGRCATECVIADIVGLTRELVGDAKQSFDVGFAHPRPEPIDAHRSFFAGDVRFAAPRNSVRISRLSLETELPARDAAMHDYFAGQAEALLGRLGGEESLDRRVTRTIIDLLPGGDASLERVAKLQAVSPRTLRRHLGEAGTSFETLLNAARLELAERYLRDPRVSIGEIALLLGFSEQASFNRAYRRWTGTTPGAVRLGAR